MKNKNEIGLVLKDKLQKLNYSPDDIVWTQIEEELKKNKKKKGYFLIIILLLSLLITTSILLGKESSSSDNQSNLPKTLIQKDDPKTENKTKDNIINKKTISKQPVKKQTSILLVLLPLPFTCSLVSDSKRQQQNILIF